MEIHLYNDKGFSIAMFDEMGMEYKGVYMPCSSSIVEFTSLQVRKLFCTWRLGLFFDQGLEVVGKNRRQTVVRTHIYFRRRDISKRRTTIDFHKTQVAQNA